MTKSWYEEEKRFSYSDFDIDDHILISRVAQLFQDISGNHAELLGCGYEKFKSQDKIWIIARSKMEIIKNPVVNHPYKATTYVTKPKGLIYDRVYRVTDSENGELVMQGTTAWCVSSLSTRRLLRPDGSTYPSDMEFDPSIEPERLLALKAPEKEEGDSLKSRVNFIDLDHNRHMNNCRYMDMATNVLSPKEGKRISVFEIDYEKECVEGEKLITTDIKEDGQSGTITCRKEGGELVFIARYRLS